jgi:signal transduction histidine kinase
MTKSPRIRILLPLVTRSWRSLSLSVKVLFWGLASIMLVTGVLMVVTYISAEASLHSQVARQVQNELTVFQRFYLLERQAYPHPEAAQVATQEMTDMMGGIAAIFVDGRAITVSGIPGDRLVPPGPPGRDGLAVLEVGGTEYVTLTQQLYSVDGVVVGTAMRGVPKRQIAEMLQRHAWGIFSVSGTAMLIAFVGLLWLTNQIVRPLRRLTRASASLLDDDHAPSRSQDEVGQLSTDFQRIAERLMAQQAQLEDAHLQRGQLLEALITAQEDERKRISRELHDETGQSLTSLLVGLKIVDKSPTLEEARKRLADLQELTSRTLEEVHKLSVELRPTLLDDLGLIAALRSYSKDFSQKYGVRVAFHATGFEERVPPLVEVAVYRVVQEALTNIAKYASAQTVHLKLERTAAALHAEVSDDGVGFDPEHVLVQKRKENRLGLLGMQERVTLLGGAFSLQSKEGEGTRITLDLPLSSTVPESAT